MQVMDKRIIVNMPAELYENVKKFAERKYISVSSLVRESLLEKIEEEFTAREMDLIQKGRRSFRESKGTNWRGIRREEV